MYSEGNLYFADWRDRKGVRHRKSFDNPETAQMYQDSMRATLRPKPQGKVVQPSGAFLPHSSPAANQGTRAPGPQGTSSRSSEDSSRTLSLLFMSPRSTVCSQRQQTHSPGKFVQLQRGASFATLPPTTVRRASGSESRKPHKRDPETSQQRRKKGQ
jgi:hypothetical protein